MPRYILKKNETRKRCLNSVPERQSKAVVDISDLEEDFLERFFSISCSYDMSNNAFQSPWIIPVHRMTI